MWQFHLDQDLDFNLIYFIAHKSRNYDLHWRVHFDKQQKEKAEKHLHIIPKGVWFMWWPNFDFRMICSSCILSATRNGLDMPKGEPPSREGMPASLLCDVGFSTPMGWGVTLPAVPDQWCGCLLQTEDYIQQLLSSVMRTMEELRESKKFKL